MAVTSFNTPLRYPGGKGRLTRYLATLIEMNNLQDGSYVEPYAGGGGLAVSLLFLEYVRTIYMNDVSRPIYSFWKAVLDYTEDLCRLVTDTPVSMDQWHRQRHVLDDAQSTDILELGFATLFLNRTNRSGIIRGGVIGGKDQTGKWKLDARYNKVELVRRIQKVARYHDRIRLYSMDAAQFINEVVPGMLPRSLLYLDPPYYMKGEGLYEHHYRERDHEEIAELVQAITNRPWIVSYDNHPAVRELYAARRQQEFTLYYSANKRFSGKEIMIFSDGLTIPNEITPSRSTSRIVSEL